MWPSGRREQLSDDAKYAITDQEDYVQELIGEPDYPDFDVDGACEAFFQWKAHKGHDIIGFPDNGYKSAITVKMAPVHHTH